jgi:recombination protein RecR
VASQLLPKALTDLIDELGKLPGVGARTAERYAYFVLKGDSRSANSLAAALSYVHTGVKQCPITFALIDADQDVSSLYTDTNRDKSIIAVVEEPLDIIALERTGNYKGTYHVLGGAISR